MKKAMVYGAGVSGKSAYKLLEKNGYDVIMIDDRVAEADKSVKNSTWALENLSGVELFIKSPGIPYNELVNKVKTESHIELIDEIELAYRYMNKNIKIIAITGTNGKTTTTSKIRDLLLYSGLKAEYAGNIGLPFSKLVFEDREPEYIVLELSSYQLENIKEFKPYISFVINLSPDHLNRYNSETAYYDAKFNIIKNINKNFFIINIDDEEILKRVKKINNSIKVSLNFDKDADYFVKKNHIIEKKDNFEQELLEVNKLSLKGIHNLQNILFIVSVARTLGIDEKTIKEFLYSTKPLEHRMEEFLEENTTLFINDSKGTNIDSTIKAINAFSKELILICGGKDKKVDLKPLAKIISEKVSEVFLIGETAGIIENLLMECGYANEKIYNLKTLENVVDELYSKKQSLKNKIILFSPAHSSFDQFKNFEVRGKTFKKLIMEKFKD